MVLTLRSTTPEEFDEVCAQVFACMARYGKSRKFKQYIDYEVFEDDWGLSQVLLRIMNFDVLSLRIVNKLRRILKNRPDWEIMVRFDPRVDPPDWRETGIRIHAYEVVDGLNRDGLPARYRTMFFIDARPAIGPQLL